MSKSQQKVNPLLLMEYLKQGDTHAQMAKKLGVHSSAIGRWITKLHLQKYQQDPTDEAMAIRDAETRRRARINTVIYQKTYLQRQTKYKTALEAVEKLRDIMGNCEMVLELCRSKLNAGDNLELAHQDMLLKASREVRETLKVMLEFEKAIQSNFELAELKEAILRCLDDVSPELAVKVVNEIKFKLQDHYPGDGEEYRFGIRPVLGEQAGPSKPVPTEVANSDDGIEDKTVLG